MLLLTLIIEKKGYATKALNMAVGIAEVVTGELRLDKEN